MGKTISASQMLSAGRKRPPSPAETGTEVLGDNATSAVDDQATKPLDDQPSERLHNETTSAVDDQATKPLDDQTSERLHNETTSAVDDQATKPLNGQFAIDVRSGAATYQRVTVFLTPAQRQWLKLTAKQLPDGLSGSDIVRLALSRLTQDATRGLDLVAHLTDQAHSDAEVFLGRRNRGLPPRADLAS